ncbi:hypothetical protein [Haloquadratum walsbyi]|uniref:hypothetical protein n=1 Tax=Haloquadratum walsbyi TaxID=293091 RepID=UPI00064EA8B7|nr:hypothetical protein [Haloquadratum walsbyi]
MSFYAGLGATLSIDDDTLSDPLGFPDGYCRVCNADIRENKNYCSAGCEQNDRSNRFCETREDRLDWDSTIRSDIT